MQTLKAPPARPAAHGTKAPLRMSEAEFIEWSGDEVRAEWIDGEVAFMNAVSADHADLTSFILHLLRGFVDDHQLGKVWGEPFQVRLGQQRRRRSPDAFFASTARLNLLERTQFNGAPDLIVEVVSKDSKLRDRRVKFLEYQAAGVQEYWLVDPMSRTFEAYTLASADKYERIAQSSGAVHSLVLPGLFFREEWVWQLKFPIVSPLLKQMARNRKKLSSTRKA